MSSVPRQPRALPPRDPNTGTLLLEAYRAFEVELFAALAAAGHRGLRPKHGAVLANVAPEGSRLTDLAADARMKKPSMKELVDELASLGLVERRPDSGDGRSRRIVLTRAGAEAVRVARRTIERIEEGYRDRLGTRMYASLRSALTALAGGRPSRESP